MGTTRKAGTAGATASTPLPKRGERSSTAQDFRWSTSITGPRACPVRSSGGSRPFGAAATEAGFGCYARRQPSHAPEWPRQAAATAGGSAMSRPLRAALVAAWVALVPALSIAQTLHIGLAEDPDVLDPTLARTFVGRVVFAAMCDKLFDIDAKLAIVPQLATGYQWSADGKALTITLRPGVKFHDGETMDAAAVKYSIERHKTMPGSNRRGELAPVSKVEVVNPLTVRLDLSAPFSPLLAQLADRAGMIVAPKAAQQEGDKFGNHPVCAGPFRFVERVPQDRIVLER